MAEETEKAFGIEKFDGAHFAYWRIQIEDYLHAKKITYTFIGDKT